MPKLPDPLAEHFADHPARAASLASMNAIETKDPETWVSLFAADAIVEDPIGPSIFDPDGHGHRGAAAIRAFYDNVIGANDAITFTISESIACGNEVANIGTITTQLPGGGGTVHTDGVFTYRVDPGGKVTALRAYWEMDRVRFE